MRRTIKNAILILLILTLSASTALLAWLQFSASDDRELSGEWTADLNVADRAAVTALGWLQDIEAVSVSLEDLESRMQDLSIQINLTLEPAGRLEGTFQCSVVPESYDACSEAAYEAFAEVFQELLAKRLRMAGYAGSTDEKTLEALVTEAFGMSTVSYLMTCGPALLPSLEDLQAQYEGSGTYEASEDILIRRYDCDGVITTKEQYYLHKGASLILSGETVSSSDGSSGSSSNGLFSEDDLVVYTLKQFQD